MDQELLVPYAAVDVAQEGPASFDGHVRYVDGGHLFLLEVVREHAAEDR